MKQVILFFCINILLLFNAQAQDITLKIKSENKEIFNETGMLKELADDYYFSQMDKLKKDITKWFRRQVEEFFYQKMCEYSLILNDSTSLSINKESKTINLVYTIPLSVKFCMENPDLDEVSRCNLDYNIVGSFEIIQNKTAESIRITNPNWTFTKLGTRISIHRVKSLILSNLRSATKDRFKVFVNNIPSSDFRTLFIPLNSLKNSFNEYIQASVINNPDLQKEFEIDETRTLTVSADANNSSLIFKHNHSPTGIVKRNVTTKPGEVSGKPNSTQPTTVPVSTSPADGIGGKNNTSKPPPIIKKPVRKN